MTANNDNNGQDYKPESFGGNVADSKFSQKKGKRVYRWLLTISILLALLVMIALVVAVSFNNIALIEQWKESTKVWLSLWRLMLFLLVIGGWRYWSVFYAKWTRLDDNQLARMLDYRWRVALWLLIMEAIFSQNILTVLFASGSVESVL